jgi:Immunity protein 10
VLAEDPTSTQGTLEVQRAHQFDAQDRALGMAGDAGPTRYGGVENWHATGDGVVLELSEQAAADLGVDRRLAIESPDPDHQALVVDALARLLVE